MINRNTNNINSNSHSIQTKSRNNIPNEFELEYVNEAHVEAFFKALSEDPESDQTEHIAAITDFMPIRQRIKRKRTPNEFEGYSYHIVRYPLIVSYILFNNDDLYWSLLCNIIYI